MPGRGVEPLLHHQALDPFTANVAITATATMKMKASVMDLSICAVPISAVGNGSPGVCTLEPA